MTETSARAIPVKHVLMKSLVDIGAPSSRDKILARATVSFSDYDIPVEAAEEALTQAVREGYLVRDGQSNPVYRITGAGMTELGPMVQEVEQPYEDTRPAGPAV